MTFSILLDPYANAFNFNASGHGHQSDKRIPKMTPAVFEGKVRTLAPSKSDERKLKFQEFG